MVKIIRLTKLTCLRCGHVWYPKSTVKPLRCAGCGTPYWDRRRRKEVSDEMARQDIEDLYGPQS